MNLTGNYDPAHDELDDNDYDGEFDDYGALRPTKCNIIAPLRTRCER